MKFRDPVARELFALSFTALFFELLVIRWLGCDFRSFMVFKTFPLVTCFVGLGVGISQTNDRLFRYTPLCLLLTSAIIGLFAWMGLRETPFPAASVYQWFNLGVLGQLSMGTIVAVMAAVVVVSLIAPFAFCVCIGSRIGHLFNEMAPLDAYCIDIGGAIVGSVCFSISSFLCLSPALQFAVVALPVLYFIRRHVQKLWQHCCLLAVGFLLCLPAVSLAGGETVWSPYERLDVIQKIVPSNKLAGNPTGDLLWLTVMVNHSFMQYFTPAPDAVVRNDALASADLTSLNEKLWCRRLYYNLPYQLTHPRDVLVLGAGTGSDVYAAIKNGAQHVDAVEIDPVIIALGKKYNPVYSNPAVNVICNDARNYVNNCKRKYDLVVFGCLDSLGIVGLSAMRTDSYIHTAESYRRCLSLLKPDGVLIISFGASTGGNGEWLRDKFANTLKTAAGYPPIVFTDELAPKHWPAYLFVTGEPVHKGLIHAVADSSFQLQNAQPHENARVVTDDWPFLYIRPNVVDLPYLFVLGIVLAITMFAGKGLLFDKKSLSSDWQLFFLGSSFMMLELQAISRLSLLYGNTWLTASVVINVILIMILAANILSIRLSGRCPQDIFYGGLLLSLLCSYFLPTDSFLQLNATMAPLGTIGITFLTLLPIFTAGLTFASAYSGTKTPARSFAYNLLGSVAGALLEYASTYVGLNALVLMAIVIYGLSYACYRLSASPAVSATSAIQPTS